MAAELPKPGVEVIQVFRTVTPTVVTPTLVPSIVGVCKQIVDVVVASASGGQELNASALVDLPALFDSSTAPGTPPAYTGLDGKDLVLSITNGPDVTVTFVDSGAGLSPAAVAAKINADFVVQGVTEAIAEVGQDGTYFRVRTYGTGEFSTISIQTATDTAVLSAFGLRIGYLYTGTSVYSQYEEVVPVLSFPDPRGNLNELSIESDTVRVFLSLGSGTNLREVSRTTSYLRAGGTPVAATVTGSVALSGLVYGVAGSVDGKTLTVSLDGAEALTVLFDAPADKVALIAQVNEQLAGVYAFDATTLQIKSKSLGAAASVKLGGTAASVLGLSTTLTYGTAGIAVVDSGNGATSPLLSFNGVDFTAAGTAAAFTGTNLLVGGTLTLPGDLTGKTLVMAVNGQRPQILTFDSDHAHATAAEVCATIAAYWSGITVTHPGEYLHAVTTATGEDATLEVLGGTACGGLGLVPTLTGRTNVADLAPDASALNGLNLRVVQGSTVVEHTFTLAGGTDIDDVVTDLNANGTFSAAFLASKSGTKLVLRPKTSVDAYVGLSVVPAVAIGEAAFLLGFDAYGDEAFFNNFVGRGLKPVSGDSLYVDGVLVGLVTAVAPGGVVTYLRVNQQLAVDAAYGDLFYMVANKLTTTSSGRPLPELIMGSDGSAIIKPNLLRDTAGFPQNTRGSVYLAYTALREDVTARAINPALLSFDSTTQLEANLSPVSPLNPLALGLYFALQNAPGASVTGLGVDEIAANMPLGTVEGFTRAAEALEKYEVYAIAPLTHDETVAQVFSTHVSFMSEPTAKGERICLINLPMPAKHIDELAASGLLGNTSVATQFDTGLANLSALVLGKGVSPVGTIPTSKGLFLSLASSPDKFSISGISGSVVTIRTAFSAGENDDGFYSTSNFAALTTATLPFIDEPFNVKVRGTALVQPNGDPDKQAIAETYQAMAQSYQNRRVWSIMPDTCEATINGLPQLIDGFYMCAAIAGMIGQQPPQQSFTNFPITGFTRAVGSNDFFTERQLNVMAAGGNYIIVQDSKGAPLTARMALTTDMTSIETRTDSITKVVDFTAKFTRQGLRTYIGRYNITQGFLDSLSHVVQGLLGFLSEIGVLIGANLNNIIQDADAPDTVLIDVTLDVPFPCNYIRLTLAI